MGMKRETWDLLLSRVRKLVNEKGDAITPAEYVRIIETNIPSADLRTLSEQMHIELAIHLLTPEITYAVQDLMLRLNNPPGNRA